jgi:hypothetical protein
MRYHPAFAYRQPPSGGIMRLNRLGLSALVGLLGVGCSATTSSRNIRTAGLVALIDVTSKAEGQSTVKTSLVVGGANSNTYVVLEGGDRLGADAGGQHQDMNAVSSGEYEAKFATSGGEFVVGLTRDVDAPAPANKGTLPPPFEITSQFDDNPLSRAKADVTLTWSPTESGADVAIHLSGDCILDQDFKVGGDPGTFTIERGKITAWEAQKKEACNIAVVITRTVSGTTDPAFDSDSRFRLHQVREARFVSGP